MKIFQPTRLGVGWTNARGATSEYSHGDISGLPALQLPPLPLDLNQGIENFVPKRLDHKAGVENLIQEAFVSGAPLEECNIITYRKNIGNIFGTVFEPDNPWTVDATCLSSIKSGDKKPISFLDVVMNVELEKKSTGGDETPYVAWGYNFAASCTGVPCSAENPEYGMLVNFMLEHDKKNKSWREEKTRFSVYLGADIDAYVPPKDTSESTPEKTSLPPMSALREIATYPLGPGKKRGIYHYRHSKWWLQSHVAGVPALVLGGRDENGIVHEIHTVSTADLPRISWENGFKWSPKQAIAFGAAALSWMADICQSEDCLNKQVRFDYDDRNKKISASIVEGEEGDLPGRVTAAVLKQKEEKGKSVVSTA